MNRDLFLAVLTMDSYNQGYGKGIDIGTQQIGNASVISSTLTNTADFNIGFSATSYNWNGQTIISYRGTDSIFGASVSGGSDLDNGYGIAIGNPLAPQALSAVNFYKATLDSLGLSGSGSTNPYTANVTFVGHSLGGGLAGLMADVFGRQADIFNAMSYRTAATDAYLGTISGNFGNIVPEVHQYIYGPFGVAPIANDPSHINQWETTGQFLGAWLGNSGAEGSGAQLDPHTNTLSTIQLHSISLEVLLLYATQEVTNTAWTSIASSFLLELYDESLAQALGVVVKAGELSTASDKIRTMIAYSVVDEGNEPYGDAAAKLMFNDANDIAPVFDMDHSQSLVAKSYLDSTSLLTDLSKLMIGYDESLAANQIHLADLPTTDGLFVSSQNNFVAVSIDSASNALQLVSDTSAIADIRHVVQDLVVNEIYGPLDSEGLAILNAAKFVVFTETATFNATDAANAFTNGYQLADSTTAGAIVLGIDGESHLTGTNNNDVLIGGSGNDVLKGSNGNDVLIGGGGRDVLVGGEGKDILKGGLGSDILISGILDNTPGSGGTANETLDGGAGADYIVLANHGSDLITLEGGDTSDHLLLMPYMTGNVAGADGSLQMTALTGGVNGLTTFIAYNPPPGPSYTTQQKNDSIDANGVHFKSYDFVIDPSVLPGIYDFEEGDLFPARHFSLFGDPANPDPDDIWYQWYEATGLLKIDVLTTAADGTKSDYKIEIKNFHQGDYGINLLDYKVAKEALLIDAYGERVKTSFLDGIDALVSEVSREHDAAKVFTLGSDQSINGLNRLATFSTFAATSTPPVLDVDHLVVRLNGSANGDVLAGTDFNERLQGHEGNDTLAGLGGDDSYTYGYGDGHDTIDENSVTGGNDKLILTDIDSNAVQVALSGNDVVLVIAESAVGAGDVSSIVLLNNAVTNGQQGIELIQFANGTIWNHDDILAHVQTEIVGTTFVGSANNDTWTGTAYNDTAYGNGGNDTLIGGAGNDTYVYTRGGGRDTVKDVGITSGHDKLVFTDINVSNITVQQRGSDAYILISESSLGAGDGGFIRLQSEFSGVAHEGVEEIHFADGTVWTAVDLMNAAQPFVDHAPIVANHMIDVSMPQETPFSFVIPINTFSDQDVDVLTYSATLSNGTALPSWLILDSASGTFSGTPPNLLEGTIGIVVTASDGTLTATDTFNLTLTHISHAPKANPDNLPNHQVNSSSFVISLQDLIANDTDADGDPLSLVSVSAYDPSAGTASINSDGNIVFTPVAGVVGFTIINYTISDPSGATSKSYVGFYVDGPTMRLASDTGISWNDKVTSDPTLRGNNGKPNSTVTLIDTVTGQTFQTHTYYLDYWYFKPTGLSDGVHTFVESESYAAGTSTASLTITIDTIAPVPTIALSTGSSSTELNGVGEANSTVTILEGAAVLGTANTDASGSWTFAPTGLADGVHDLTVSQTDLAGNKGTANIAVTLGTTVTPPMPTVALVSDTGISASDNITKTATLKGTAQANAVVTIYEGTIVLGTASTDTTGNWSFTPTGLANGYHIFTVSQTDLAGNTGTTTLAVTLDTTAPVPTIALVTDNGTSNTDLNTSNAALEGTAEANSVVTIKDGATVLGAATTSATGAWTFTPAGLADGAHAFSVSQTDVAGNTGTANFLVTLDTTAPVLALPLPDQMSAEDAAINFTLPAGSFYDAGIATLNYTATLSNGSALPAWLSFNAVTQTFSGMPPQDFNGNVDVKVTASDGNFSTSDDFTLTITPVNDAPIVALHLVNQASAEDTAFSFGVPAGSFIDVDNEVLSYSATLSDGTALPTWITFNASTQTLSGTPPQDWNSADHGTLSIKVTASDGSLTVSDNFVLNITPVNDAPVAHNDGPISALYNAAVTVTAASLLGNDTDVDSPLLTITGVSNATHGTVLLQANGSILFTPDADYIGTASFTYIVDDGLGGTASAIATLNVHGVAGQTITGTSANNVLTGTTGDDTMYGLGGNDTLNGNGGVDTLVGGIGNDIYVVDSVGDKTIELANEGTDLVQSSISWTLGTSLENLTLTGTANLNGTGNSSVNTITGNVGNNILSGGGGLDTLVGGLGDDTYIVDQTGVIITEAASAGLDTVQSSVTWILGNNLENLILTGTAAINGTGNTIANTITGNSADNILNGGTGADTLIGGFGDDTYVVDNVGDITTEAANGGTDLVQATVTWTLGANFENLTLMGTAAVNGTGNELANIITGNTGNNILDGGLGADTLIGNIGNDTYVVDNLGDTIVEAVNAGTDLVKSSVDWTLGANLENLTLTGTGNINGTGNSAINTITGNAGNNILNGGGGLDILVGGLGDDTYIVDQTGIITTEAASAGIDTVQSSVSWTLATNLENLTLLGAAAIDGTGNTLANVITGNAANNVLNGGAGADTLLGGLGEDTYVVDNVGDVVTELTGQGVDLVQSSIAWTLTDSVENLTLTGTASINGTGNALDNVITGNGGNNILNGGLGADTLVGGLGNDTYVVDNVGDITTELAGGGTDLVQASLSWMLGSELDILTLTGFANIDGTGNSLVNVITGNTGNNILNGAGGLDTLVGGLGDDTYVVDVAGVITTEAANAGLDTVQSSVTWTLATNFENLSLTGTSAINGTGNTLANTITGNAADNVLNGGIGADTLIGGFGNDTYVVDNVGDITTEATNAGTDLVQSSVTWTLGANLENLTLTGTTAINGTGNTLDNILIGNAAANTLNGGTGNDFLTGAAGNDILTGGLGNDTFNFSVGFGKDTITDFTAGLGVADVLHLTVGAAFDTYAEVMAAATQVGANTLISISATDTITLNNVLKTALVADDFSFI
jgi:Ca2+-binding RTX toxin-like protein